MLDPKLEDDLMKEITSTRCLNFIRFDTWIYDDIKAKISLVMTRVYQEGMRDAFLKMGTFMKK